MKRKLSTKLSTTIPGVKKAEGKEKHFPYNPYKEKGKGKESRRGSYRTHSGSRACACGGVRIRVRACAQACRHEGPSQHRD